MATRAAPPTPSHLPLAWQVRADMFAQLAAMEKAGLPAVQALGLLRLPQSTQTRVAAARKQLVRGTDLAGSGRRAGLFTELEANLVGAASSAGSPAPTYRRLAEYYAARASQARSVKSRMALPGLVLLTGLFTQGLPALFAGNISPGRYLFHALLPLAAIAALVLSVRKLSAAHEGPSGAAREAIGKLAMGMPLFGPMLVRRNIRDFFESLALMLEAGLPILEALPKALDTMQLGPVKKEFASIAGRIERGSNFNEALASNRFLGNSQALALIGTGEASGSLPDMLFRFAEFETEAINNFNKQVADWLPRIIYAAVAAWVAYGILSGPGVGPQLPEELR